MVTIGGKRGSCSPDRALPSQNSFSLAPPSMESLKGYLMIWLLYGIFAQV